MDAPEPNAPSSAAAANRRGVVIALAILVAVLVGAWFAYGTLAGQAEPGDAAAAQATASSDENLPHLEDYDAQVLSALGDSTSLVKIADGKPLVINFWATWCPYCIQEMDDFQVIYDDYGDWVNFAFVDATDGVRETIEDARAWIEERDYTLPFYFDTRYEATGGFGVQAFPTTVVVAANGDILTISAGRIDPDLMRSALDSLR